MLNCYPGDVFCLLLSIGLVVPAYAQDAIVKKCNVVERTKLIVS
ncbi:hypothetical protein [Syntrophomonas wolfei]|nr:hypothetical protein [Syntrophomonas wolfei]